MLIHAHLRSCERFDPAAGAWEAVPDMSAWRFAPAVAVLDGKLWVSGGEGYPGMSGPALCQPWKCSTRSAGRGTPPSAT